jgi:hypothetical protein
MTDNVDTCDVDVEVVRRELMDRAHTPFYDGGLALRAVQAIAQERAARERAEARCRSVAKQMRAAAANTPDHVTGVGLHALADELDGSVPNPFNYPALDQRGNND